METINMNSPEAVNPYAKELVDQLKKRHLSVCTCESLTAGLCCSTIASVPGASVVLKGGLVTYETKMKELLAHVPHQLLEQFGAVSEECALTMASNTRKIMDADYCISFTGNAGPDVMEGKPAGLIYCAIADREKTSVIPFHIHMPRNALRQTIVNEMLQILSEKVKNLDPENE